MHYYLAKCSVLLGLRIDGDIVTSGAGAVEVDGGISFYIFLARAVKKIEKKNELKGMRLL